MPSEPPISSPVVFRPDGNPALLVGGAGEHRARDRDRDRDEDDPEASPGDEHAGQEVGGVAAVGLTPESRCWPRRSRSQRRAGRGLRRERSRDRRRRRRRPSRRRTAGTQAPGLERLGPEHVLQVQRREQERSPQHGGGEHQHEAAADGAVDEALDAQQRRPGAQLEPAATASAPRPRRSGPPWRGSALLAAGRRGDPQPPRPVRRRTNRFGCRRGLHIATVPSPPSAPSPSWTAIVASRTALAAARHWHPTGASRVACAAPAKAARRDRRPRPPARRTRRA